MKIVSLAYLASVLGAVIASVPMAEQQMVIQVDDLIREQQDLKIKNQSILEFHKKLVEIPSISGNEIGTAYYLKNFLEEVGLTVELQEVDAGGRNVYAYKGQKRDNKVLLTSHIDTVPPFLPYKVKGSRIYGRGSCDAKASVASMVFTYLDLIEKGLIKDGDLALLFVVGEEFNGRGMIKASRELGTSWEIGIFGEPTELKLGTGHKGALKADVEVQGIASHSGYPELGISATETLIPFLLRLLELDFPSSDVLGNTTLNIGRIEAGVAANVIPPYANAECILRIAQDPYVVQELLEDVAQDFNNLTLNLTHAVEPQFVDYDVEDFDTIALSYFTDIPNMAQKLKKRYLYGPGSILVAHGDHEYIEVADLFEATKGYEKLVAHSLNQLKAY